MNGVTYVLRTLDPVLANSLAGDANSAETLPYIPGGLVRGALAARYLGRQPLRDGDPRYDDFRRLFLRPATRYLHAYAALGNDRLLPTPLSWRQPKDDPEVVYDLAESIPNVDDLKSLEFHFARLMDGNVQHRELGRQVHVHTQRDAVLGRAATNRGAVYRYESLPAGVELRGVILTATANDATTLMGLLRGQTLPLGKARTAGYGRVQVVAVEELKVNWQELDTREGPDLEPTYEREEVEFEPSDTPEPEDEQTEEVARFWLRFLSAGLLRGPAGQYDLDPTTALRARLGPGVKVDDAFVFRRGEIVGGFNREWGTYLPQSVAIAPGSVFRCHADPPLSQEALVAVEESGLGDRRGEGFGRVAIVTELVGKMSAGQWEETKPPLDDLGPLPPQERPLAEAIVGRMLRTHLDETLLAKAPKPYKNPPSRAQLGRWRVVVRNALADVQAVAGFQITDDAQAVAKARAVREQARERVRVFALGQRVQSEDERETTTGRDGAPRERRRATRSWQKMNRARITTGRESIYRLAPWIEEVLTKPESPWHILGQPPTVQLGDVTARADDLAVEYQLRLIDLVLERLRQAGGNND